ncbi:hypothetical protein J6590_092116 [Homalodisca vitripennis]|nr:hypothetical protein J6590_092116 [Homalodisca vitripennis]
MLSTEQKNNQIRGRAVNTSPCVNQTARTTAMVDSGVQSVFPHAVSAPSVVNSSVQCDLPEVYHKTRSTSFYAGQVATSGDD